VLAVIIEYNGHYRRALLGGCITLKPSASITLAALRHAALAMI